MEIIYSIEKKLDPDEFLTVLVESTLGERRPIGDRIRIEKMCKYANLIFTARHLGRLVGVARCLTDFALCNLPYFHIVIQPQNLPYHGKGNT